MFREKKYLIDHYGYEQGKKNIQIPTNLPRVECTL